MGDRDTTNRPRLFGTDGIRGTANVEPMTSETVVLLGRAIAHVVKRHPHRHKIIIGKDTRLSGYMLESALTSGICSMGVDVLLVGPLPTPGIAFLTRSMRADAGVVISASHNPFQDNGIKFFASNGFKLPDELEREIERLLQEDAIAHLRPTAQEVGKAFRIDDALGRYNVFLKSTFPKHLTLDGLKIVIDGAHGAAYRVGPEVLEGSAPGGGDRRRRGGTSASLQPAGWRGVRPSGLGIALDSDADRVIFIDEHGGVVDGDAVLAILGIELQPGRLTNGGVMATVMSNRPRPGAARARHRVTRAGRRPFRRRGMLRSNHVLGGERSSLSSFLTRDDHDGLVTAGGPPLMVESGRAERAAGRCSGCRSGWSTSPCASAATSPRARRTRLITASAATSVRAAGCWCAAPEPNHSCA
jgi:phosphoglucosamine mutase